VDLPLRTARLELRTFTDADIPAAHAIYSDPEVMRYVGRGAVSSENETRGMLAAYAAHQAAHGFSFWAVVERETGTLIGDAGLFFSQSIGPEVEVGYTLARSAWGQGYATEAARAALEWTWASVETDQLISLIAPGNAASIRVAERLGLDRLREHALDGRAVLIYGIDRPGEP
jgi:[ribosomal protein S5]-alanine N-acetyltransferase